MNSMPANSGAKVPAMVRVVQVFVTLVAGFWIWFAASVAFGEGMPSVGPAAAVIAACVALATASWWWPRLGGAVLIVAAALSAWLFPSPSALGLMSAPFAIAGLALLLLRARQQGASQNGSRPA